MVLWSTLTVDRGNGLLHRSRGTGVARLRPRGAIRLRLTDFSRMGPTYSRTISSERSMCRRYGKVPRGLAADCLYFQIDQVEVRLRIVYAPESHSAYGRFAPARVN